ncbi:amino acid adenylation domain-containing protein [Micromonospora matsumotoense]|uniref:amino acid adenylation domain-containing protein n=1 Tax=Micromonospora matsumotoense TaxID=121616 RepID=UPI00342786C7
MRSTRYDRVNSETTIHDAFGQVAREFPHRVAVVTATRAVTYAELAARARRTAHHLVGHGVRPGSVVPVLARRSPDLAATLLGILMAGGAYGILDVRWPLARITRLLHEMRPAIVLADAAGSARLDPARIDHTTFATLGRAAPPAMPVDLPRVSPDSCATVFWTSGSTGVPRAVLSPHRATTRLFAPRAFLSFGDHPVMIHAAAVAWDAFTLELWGMLLSGGTAVVHEDDLLLPPAIRTYVRDLGATHLFLTPSLFDVIAYGDITCLGGLRTVLLGGDKPSPASCRRLLDTFPDIELYNGYGPVESCVFATVHRITGDDPDKASGIPAGLPVPGTALHVIRDGVPVRPGEPGDIAIAGTGLALGYLDAPEQTSSAFRHITVEGTRTRVYLTGDQGRLDDAGVLHFIGRRDTQLKIAGHRIEPAEIESAVRALGGMRPVILPIPDRNGTPRIVLFAERPAGGMTEMELQGHLRETLPHHLVPTRVHFVSSMPLLENTKIDRRELWARFGYDRARRTGFPNHGRHTPRIGKESKDEHEESHGGEILRRARIHSE